MYLINKELQKNKTKIAIVSYNMEMGGLSTAIVNLYKNLVSSGLIELELLTIDQVDILNHGIPSKDFSNRGKAISIIGKIEKYLRLKRYLKVSNFDFIIDQRFRINPMSEFFFIKFLYPSKNIIYSIHSANINEYLPKSKWLTNYLFSNAYGIISCSKGVSKLVKKEYNLNNVCTIYNTLDEDVFNKSYCKIFGFKYIVAVGRFHKVKQFDKLIVCYSKSDLPKKGIKLVLIGDGDEYNYCNKLCEKLNIKDDVVFTGKVSNPASYISHAMFLVLCSQYEGFGMVLLESLACSTPVLSFDLVAGPNEIIKQNENGVLVENQDFEALRKTMEKIVSDKNMLKEFKSNAKDSIRSFSNKNVINDWLELLNINK